jgi:hypothetical protein
MLVPVALSLAGMAVSAAVIYRGFDDHPTNTTLTALGWTGMFVAPSLGQWYEGKLLSRGMAIRAVGSLATAIGMYYLAARGETNSGINSEALPVIGAGLLLYTAGALDDLISAPLRVRKHNRRIEGLGLAPAVTDRSLGFALGGRF